MKIEMIEIGEDRSYVKLFNGSKELSFSFRKVGSGQPFLESVGMFTKEGKAEYVNNVDQNNIDSFMEWFSK